MSRAEILTTRSAPLGRCSPGRRYAALVARPAERHLAEIHHLGRITIVARLIYQEPVDWGA